MIKFTILLRRKPSITHCEFVLSTESVLVA